MGRHTVPPCTTERKITINLKTKKQPELTENRTVWKSENQGVKKKRAFRPVGGKETGSQAERNCGEVAVGRPGKAEAGGVGNPTFACT